MRKNIIIIVFSCIFTIGLVNTQFAQSENENKTNKMNQEEEVKRKKEQVQQQFLKQKETQAEIQNLQKLIQELVLQQQRGSLNDTDRMKLQEQIKILETKLFFLNKQHDFRNSYPEFYETLEKVKNKDEAAYQRLYLKAIENYNRQQALAKQNPEIAELEIKSQEIELKLSLLKSEYHTISDTKKQETIKNEMKEHLTILFDLKVKKRKLEIANLNDEIQKLESELKKIEKNKDESIQLKLKQMTEGDVFSW